MTQKRLPKLRRMPEAVADKRITDRGIEIIRIILRYRFISTGTLVAVAGGNEDVTYRHLQQLYHQGLISRFTLPRSENRGEFIYFLENAAALRGIAHRLAPEPIDWMQIKGNHEKYAEMDVSENGDGYGKFLFIRHELMISDFHASLELGCRASEGRVELARWMQGAALWSRVRMPSKQTLPHRPDAFFTLPFPLAPEGQQRSNFFYEADRATTNLTRFKQKLEAHLEYLKQGKQQALGMKRIRAVLIETTAEIRAEQCMELAVTLAAREPLARQMFWFSVEPADATTTAFDAAWRVSSDPRPRRLND
jgi:hypothetical protein